MSALCLALSSNASASLIDAQQVAINYDVSDEQLSSKGSHAAFTKAMAEAKQAIDEETKGWQEKYSEIESSDNPIQYFHAGNVAQLESTDLIVRGNEMMLRVQVEELFSKFGEKIPSEVALSIRQLRISVAKLRMSITNVMDMEKQLRPAISADKASFTMTPDALESMKAATKNAYFH
ncbi:hypothetical protein [Salinivibrio sp. ES.052]|uniref:hypothetical protein n=1 Tax=Salinivibrio sp. ES.052 TaxID=1882823 RepID=UPI0009272E67|nr:hypothetical protein [Salinivibrio sp. ES.052]SIO27677.1 hypothetical protein SAMN05444724_2577 [Salinivibrio sp. ES.052]